MLYELRRNKSHLSICLNWQWKRWKLNLKEERSSHRSEDVAHVEIKWTVRKPTRSACKNSVGKWCKHKLDKKPVGDLECWAVVHKLPEALCLALKDLSNILCVNKSQIYTFTTYCSAKCVCVKQFKQFLKYWY